MASQPQVTEGKTNTVRASDWQEGYSSSGRRYFYNTTTKESIWENPLEMTPIQALKAAAPDSPSLIVGPVGPATPDLPVGPDFPVDAPGSSLVPTVFPGASNGGDVEAAPPARRDTTRDSFNDETFGSNEITSEDRAEEERRRRASFEFMRKEQQEKRKAKVKNEWTDTTSNCDLDTDLGKSALPSQTWRPLVPPGFANFATEKDSGLGRSDSAEYVMQRKKIEAEERKKKSDEFAKMLEESKNLTSSTRWSEVVKMFEDDERFKAVEWAERVYLLKIHLEDLREKKRAKDLKSYELERLKFRSYLDWCWFVEENTKWRDARHRLIDKEISTLEEHDRLEIYKEYMNDLEKKKEQKKEQKKQQQKVASKLRDRINRDNFRELMLRHVNDGTLTAKTPWSYYRQKVKKSGAYLDVDSNTSGSTPKDLFDEASKYLAKQASKHKEKGEKEKKKEERQVKDKEKEGERKKEKSNERSRKGK